MPRRHRPKVCVECGDEFIPNSGVQKRCDDCRLVTGTTNPVRKQRDPTRTVESKPKEKVNIERIRNTELGLRLNERCRAIEEESYSRFREEKESDGDV